MKNILAQLGSLILPITVLVLVPLLIEDQFQISFDALAVVGLVIGLLGLPVLGLTIRMFIQIGRGTLAPWSPTRKLITSSLYAYMRNPMITAVWLILIGESLVFHSIRIFTWSILFFVINTIYFVASEEPGLVKRFGTEYLEYRKNVPRWLPRLEPWKPQAQEDTLVDESHR